MIHETTSAAESVCAGCGLALPAGGSRYDGNYNASAECWAIYTEVLGYEFENLSVFMQVHQLTVDTYAVQHAGAPQSDKSVCIHLCGLYLVLEQGLPSPDVPARLRRIVERTPTWPHFPRPAQGGCPTVFDVGLAHDGEDHVARVRGWARCVWAAWSGQHAAIAAQVARTLESR